MLPPLGTTGRASIVSDVTGWGGGCCASRVAGGGVLLLVQRGREAPRGGAAEFVHGFFLFAAVTERFSLLRIKYYVKWGRLYATPMNLYNLIFEMAVCIQIEIYEFISGRPGVP